MSVTTPECALEPARNLALPPSRRTDGAWLYAQRRRGSNLVEQPPRTRTAMLVPEPMLDRTRCRPRIVPDSRRRARDVLTASVLMLGACASVGPTPIPGTDAGPDGAPTTAVIPAPGPPGSYPACAARPSRETCDPQAPGHPIRTGLLTGSTPADDSCLHIGVCADGSSIAARCNGTRCVCIYNGGQPCECESSTTLICGVPVQWCCVQ